MTVLDALEIHKFAGPVWAGYAGVSIVPKQSRLLSSMMSGSALIELGPDQFIGSVYLAGRLHSKNFLLLTLCHLAVNRRRHTLRRFRDLRALTGLQASDRSTPLLQCPGTSLGSLTRRNDPDHPRTTSNQYIATSPLSLFPS